MQASPETFLKASTPYRDAMGVAVAGLFPWYWLAALWAQAGLPCVLGHALSLKAIHGGKAKNDTSDAHTRAVGLRGGLLPQASVSPAAMRATRARLRRRRSLPRKRAELLAPIQNTNSPSTLPAIGQTRAYKAHRDGGAARCPALAVHKSLAVDLALLGYDDPLLRALELHSVKAARQHDAPPLYRLQTVPGIGHILSLVLLYEMHAMQRCPRGQDCVASGRLVKCAKAAAGKRYGTAGAKIGNAYLKWAFAAAAGLFLRDNPAGQQSLTR